MLKDLILLHDYSYTYTRMQNYLKERLTKVHENLDLEGRLPLFTSNLEGRLPLFVVSYMYMCIYVLCKIAILMYFA